MAIHGDRDGSELGMVSRWGASDGTRALFKALSGPSAGLESSDACPCTPQAQQGPENGAQREPVQTATDALDAVLAVVEAHIRQAQAEALREAAKRYAAVRRPDSGLIPVEWADGFMEALDGVFGDLNKRADELDAKEGGQHVAPDPS